MPQQREDQTLQVRREIEAERQGQTSQPQTPSKYIQQPHVYDVIDQMRNPSPTSPSPLESAITKIGAQPGTFKLSDVRYGQGTSTTRQGEFRVNPFGLTREEGEAYTNASQATTRANLLNLGLTLGAGISFGAAPVSASIGVGASLGINQAVKGVQGGGFLTPKEAGESALFGAVTAGVGTAVMSGVKAVVPSVVANIFGRATVNAGVGAGISYAVTRDPIEAAKGAAIGAAFSIGADLVLPRIMGYRATRVKGAAEIEKSVISPEGDTVTSERLTSLKLENERLSYRYGKFIKENQRFFVPDEVDFAGKETVAMRGGGELDIYPDQSYNSASRPAEPYLNAAKGKNSLIAQTFASGDDFVSREIVTTGKLPGRVYQKTVVSKSGGFIGAETTLTERSLSTAQFFGDIDSQVYLKYLKVVPKDVSQSWLKQMGGLSYEQIVKPTSPKTIRVFTDYVDVSPSKVSMPTIAAISALQKSPTQQSLASPSIVATSKRETITFPSIMATPRRDTITYPIVGPIQNPSSMIWQGQPQIPRQEHPQIVVPATIPDTITTPDTVTTTVLMPALPRIHSPHMNFPGFKFEGGGISNPALPRFTGLSSRKRKWPILTGEQILGLSIRSHKRRHRK